MDQETFLRELQSQNLGIVEDHGENTDLLEIIRQQTILIRALQQDILLITEKLFEV